MPSSRSCTNAHVEAKRAGREREAGRVRGPLHGIFYGAKDLLATIDAPTTWGAAPYRKQHFDVDATVIKRLHDAGSVLLAKLAMVELADGFGYDEANASFTGLGRTPWNRAYRSGGSSSGSGEAVGAGLVGFAIGSETSTASGVRTDFTRCVRSLRDRGRFAYRCAANRRARRISW